MAGERVSCISYLVSCILYLVCAVQEMVEGWMGKTSLIQAERLARKTVYVHVYNMYTCVWCMCVDQEMVEGWLGKGVVYLVFCILCVC